MCEFEGYHVETFTSVDHVMKALTWCVHGISKRKIINAVLSGQILSDQFSLSLFFG